ncbi:MAG: hypothetical protein J6M10_03710 [Clostridia bacterium]|nr:hypothetical protein [Clostridia bacterium]
MREISAERYEILYDLPSGEYDERAVGGTCTHTIRSGELLEVKAYPIVRIDTDARRERRRRESGAAQQELNHKNSWQWKMRLLEANFGEGDFIVHPTFSYTRVDRDRENIDDTRREWKKMGIPMDDEEAREKLRLFIKRLRRRVKKKGGNPDDFKYLYEIETTFEPREEDMNPLPCHYHAHMAMSSCGVLSMDDINELWPYGYTNAKRVDMRFDGLKGFAKYITKKERKKRRGRSLRWARSLNLVLPEEKRSSRKISRRRAARIARDVEQDGRAILEAIYPGYRVEEVDVRYSDFVAGAYIYARLRKRRQ